MLSVKSTILSRWVVINSFLVAVAATAFYNGVLDRFLIDQTYITHFIIVLFAGSLVANFFTIWSIHQSWKTIPDRTLVYQSYAANGRDAEQRDLIAEEFSQYLGISKLAGTLFVSLGLFGTVIGILLSFSNVDPSVIGDPTASQGVIVMLLSGLTTAFNTTLAGLVCMMWNMINLYLIRVDLSKMFTTILRA